MSYNTRSASNSNSNTGNNNTTAAAAADAVTKGKAISVNKAQEMVETRLVNRINTILQQCGLSFAHPSTQIYSKPQRVHAIAPGDLGFIASNAHLLITRSDVICDFEALHTVLWGMMTEMEGVVSKLVQSRNIVKEKIEKKAMLPTNKSKEQMTTKNMEKKEQEVKQSQQQQQQQQQQHEEPEQQQDQEENAKAQSTSEKSEAKSNAVASNDNNRANQIGSTKRIHESTEQICTTLQSVLAQILRVLLILGALESVDAREAIRRSLHPLQTHAELLIRLARNIIKLFNSTASQMSVSYDDNNNNSNNNSKNTFYSRKAHITLRAMEMAVSSLLQFIALLTSRPSFDVSITLHFLSSEEVWGVSGNGYVLLDGYCKAVEVCMKTLFARRTEYDNVNEIVAELIWTRLAKRPPFQLKLFELLYFRPDEYIEINALDRVNSTNITANTIIREKDVMAFGLLLLMRRVQRGIEELVEFNVDFAEPTTNDTTPALLSFASPYLQAVSLHFHASRETRKTSLLYLRRLQESSEVTLLSYSQLLLLSAIQGMPEVDFTDELALNKRASETKLVDASDASVLDVYMLRLLMACCYTVHYTFYSKNEQEQESEAEVQKENEANNTNVYNSRHSPVSTASIMAVYDAMSHYLFQMPTLSTMSKTNNSVSNAITSTSTIINGDESDDTKAINKLKPFFASSQLRAGSLMKFLLLNAVHNTKEVLLNTITTTTEEVEQSSSSSSLHTVKNEHNRVNCNTPTNTVNQNHACSLLLYKMTNVLQTLYSANNEAEKFSAQQNKQTLQTNANNHHHNNSHSKNKNSSNKINNYLATTTTSSSSLPRRKGNEELALRLTSRMITTLHLILLHSDDFIKLVDKSSALHNMVLVFAIRMYYSASPRISVREQMLNKVVLRIMHQRLTTLVLQMTVNEVNNIVLRHLSRLCNPAITNTHTLLEVRLIEGYLRALSTSGSAFVMRDGVLLNHYMNIFIYCVTFESTLRTSKEVINRNRVEEAYAQHVNIFNDLVITAHDFVVAAFLAKKTLSILFVPTYVSVFVPPVTRQVKYGVPPSRVIKHFASRVRAACQGIEMCETVSDENLHKIIDEVQSNISGNFTSKADDINFVNNLSEAQREAIEEITPSNATMLVVAALFDKLCDLWNKELKIMNGNKSSIDNTKVEEFTAYFSALANLLQCKDSAVLQRVCASIEAIEVEHLRGSGSIQLKFLKYIQSTVDNIRGTTKKGIAEWLLKVSAKVMKEQALQSKLESKKLVFSKK